MKKLAVRCKNPSLGADLRKELLLHGIETLQFEIPEDLRGLGLGEVSAIVLVNPEIEELKMVRDIQEELGGWASRIPLIIALERLESVKSDSLLKDADDFVIAPFRAEELIKRADIILSRRNFRGKMISFDELKISLDSHQVFLNGRPVDFTLKEFELLTLLASHPGRVFRREELLRRVWGYDYYGGTRTVDVHIRRIRGKLERRRRYIETVHGIGYRFVSE